MPIVVVIKIIKNGVTGEEDQIRYLKDQMSKLLRQKIQIHLKSQLVQRGLKQV